MAKNHKIYYRSTSLVALLLGLLFIPGFSALATSVDRMAITNLEGFPGKTIEQEITLEGTDPGERSGFWYTYYKKTAGDNDRMDITSWITIEPKDFTIKQGETKIFTITVKIPRSAGEGLWGATSSAAGQEGHSAERRTYIVFKDAQDEGNVYSGLLIPVSVKVGPSANPLTAVTNFVMSNIMTVGLAIIIVVLLAILLLKKKK